MLRAMCYVATQRNPDIVAMSGFRCIHGRVSSLEVADALSS